MTSSNQNIFSHDDQEGNGEMKEEAQTLENQESSTYSDRPKEESANFTESSPHDEHHKPEREPDQQDEQHHKPEREPDQQLVQVLGELQKLPDAEARLQYAIDFMEASLAQSGSPNFKNFWEIRKHCLEYFKENIPPGSRASLWNKYSDLSKEARRLKEILDEQSAFAVEQIEIAITALETELQNIDTQVEKIHPLEFPHPSNTLKKQYPKYDLIQRQLNLLNTYASRVNMLRKELIKTDMRVRQKNKFFQRLSLTGDQIFPKRKDLIKEISTLFIKDVEDFIQRYFANDDLEESLYVLREEIKALQSIAKILTLNTHSFTHTRTLLSNCWDKVKGLEKERKKVRAQQRVVFKENVDSIVQEIHALKQSLESGEINIQDGNAKHDEISNQMRRVELGRDEVKFLRSELSQVKKIIQDKLKTEEQLRQDQERERNRQKQQKVDELKQSIDNLLANVEQYEYEQLTKEREEINSALANTPMSKLEKQAIERQLRPLKDLITEKKEKALLNLSDDDKQTLQQLKEILAQRKERRVEIKNQIEVYRKAHGNSGFDIEQAMLYNEQMHAEKERLEKINQGIQEVEQKISDLQKK